MTMRGTTKITNNNALYYISQTTNAFYKLSNQVSAEKQVLDLEDNPMSANIGMRMMNIISRTEQYKTNIKAGVASLSLLDGKLGSAKTGLDEVKKILTDTANSATKTPEMRSTAATQLLQTMKSLVMTGNAKDGARYIFGGESTLTAPFTIVNGRYVNYTGNDKKINIYSDNNTTTPINCTGEQTYGNMITTIPSRDLSPDVNLATDRSTRLSDLNAGQGVPKGKITIYYSAYPEGLEVDLSSCDTLEDVKDVIEKATLDASRALDPAQHRWLNGTNLDWRDLQDHYVKVTVNPEHNGISLREFDLGEPLPAPTVRETAKGLDYTGAAGTPYQQGGGGFGIASATPDVETTVHDKQNTLYTTSNGYYAPLRVDDYAHNKVAEALGIKGTANKYDPNASVHDPVLDGFLHGRDLNPKLSDRTLLADLEGYNDSVYTFTNGSKPSTIVVRETTQDSSNVFNNWQLSGLSKGDNTGPNGELYARVVNKGAANSPEYHVELYSCPIDKAKASDLVAAGVYTESRIGGTVVLNEVNNSGLSGTVGIVLGDSVKESTVNLSVEFGDTLTASVHVPAFVEELNPDGTLKDVFNIASGWSIRGLDKPPASGYDKNHPVSTDLDGDVSINYRYDAATRTMNVEVYRPSFNGTAATLVAGGSLYMGDAYAPPTGNFVSGRVELVGVAGFEGVKGSVYLEIPANAAFASASTAMGANSAAATGVTYQLNANAAAGTIHFGGAVELKADQDVTMASVQLTGDTLFKKGQIFDQDVHLPGGGRIIAGVPLTDDLLVPKGVYITASELKAGTVLAEGQTIQFNTDLAAGTVIPRGSYYTAGLGLNAGFPADGMAMTVTQKNPVTGVVQTPQSVVPMGYDLRATFATIEDFNRAVEESGIYVTSGVSADGKSLEFRSSLAGAWLTVSEDTDCYEQMNDKYNQLSALDLNGLVKGVSADKNGGVHTEVIFYPPDPLHPDRKVSVVGDNGKVYELDPGYYVRVYSDPDQLKKPYADRDNTTMVAEGFLPAGDPNPAFDPTLPVDATNSPYLPNAKTTEFGLAYGLGLEERNNSGVWGTVNLDYYGGKPMMTATTVTNPDLSTTTTYNYNPYENGQITVYPGGLRPENTRHTTIQEWDIVNPVPGVNCDYSGTFHGTITGNPASAATSLNNPPVGVDIKMYKDGSNTRLLAMSIADPTNPDTPYPAMQDGKVILYEVDAKGKIAKDANGNPIIFGTMAVADAGNLNAGVTDSFKLTTGAIRNNGQEREENVFSTINDAIDALNAADDEALHNLIGSAQKDIDRMLDARADVGSRQAHLEWLTSRHSDDLLRYETTKTSRIGMDDDTLPMYILRYQAAMNAMNAAMKVGTSAMQMSILDYI